MRGTCGRALEPLGLPSPVHETDSTDWGWRERNFWEGLLPFGEGLDQHPAYCAKPASNTRQLPAETEPARPLG